MDFTHLDESHLEEKKLGSEEIYKGHLLHVFKDTVSLPDGTDSAREYIHHLGAVAIVPVTDDGKVILERQFRYPFHKAITEVPAGKIDRLADGSIEDPLVAAKRELIEETGLTADEWISLGSYYPSAAYTDEVLGLFLARGLHKGERDLDPGEMIDLYPVPIEEAIEMVMNDEVPDGKSQCALLKAARYLKK